ncbi:hypothetical protein HZA39_01995 [Candidatus Peregrinibacteria bacterium]|nr:hypothetical protein [Candidatus Peregrinibacteria bacterium]
MFSPENYSRDLDDLKIKLAINVEWYFEKERLIREKYLTNPPELSDLWIKQKLFRSALKPIAAHRRGDKTDILESKGANMEVYDFVEEDLERLLLMWVSQFARLGKKQKNAIKKFSHYLSQRFVVKIGNTRDYPIKFGLRPEVFPREYMEDAFGTLGYPVVNREKRVRKNASEVARANLYLGYEEKTEITGPDIISVIYRFVLDIANPDHFDIDSYTTFFIREDEDQFLEGLEDFSPGGIDGKEYITLNKEKRESADMEKFEDDLKPFFDSLVTIGFHDTIRRLVGHGRHTELNYEQAAKIIKELCDKYKTETFLLPEQTTFGYDPRVSSEEWKKIIANNNAAVEYFSKYLHSLLSGTLEEIFSDQKILHGFSYAVVEHWHQVPDYEVDPATSVLSTAMLKLLMKAAYYYFLWPEPNKNKDFNKHEKLQYFFFKEFNQEEQAVLRSAMTIALYHYEFSVRSAKCPRFRRFERTQMKTQDKMNYDKGNQVVEGSISIKELITARRDLLKKYPELGEKLVVYFYQLYKMYRETSYVLDMRPENVLKNVFLLGEWALLTENIQVTIFKDKQGELYSKVVNIDPEDNFRIAPEDEKDRDPNEGLATYGLNLAGPVAVRSLKKALARMIDEVALAQRVHGSKTEWPVWKKALQWMIDLFEQSAKDAADGTQFTTRSIRAEIKNNINKALKTIARYIH